MLFDSQKSSLSDLTGNKQLTRKLTPGRKSVTSWNDPAILTYTRKSTGLQDVR